MGIKSVDRLRHGTVTARMRPAELTETPSGERVATQLAMKSGMNEPADALNASRRGPVRSPLLTRRAGALLVLGALAGVALAPPVARGAPAASGAATDPLVRKVVEAYGGAAPSRAVGVRETGSVTARDGKRGALTRLLVFPDSLRVDIAYPDGTGEVRITHQGKGSREGVDVSGTPPHHAMVLQAARLAMPRWLAEDPARARRAGRVERDGRSYEALAVSLPDGLEVVAEVEPASGRIVRTVGVMQRQGQRFEFVNTYSDFRKVAGVLFAFREENYAGGQQTGVTVLDEVELLTTVPPASFEDPAAKL